jgi:BMFP domain-containing protein YqiC
MNLEEMAKAQGKIRKYVFPDAFVSIAYFVAGKEFLGDWTTSNFKHGIQKAETVTLKTLLMNDPNLVGMHAVLRSYASIDFGKLRTENWVDLQLTGQFQTFVSNITDSSTILLSSMRIDPSKDKRDAELSRILVPLHELLNDKVQEEYKEIQGTDALQIIKKLPDYAPGRRHKYAWACVLSDDELKNCLANCMIGVYAGTNLVRLLAEKYLQAASTARKDIAVRDRKIGECGEEIKRLKANSPVNPDAQLRADYEKLQERVRELEAKQPVVPADAAQLQKELTNTRENAATYQGLLETSDKENKALTERVQALEGRLEGITAQAHQRHEQENGVYESFAMYAVREGYDADLAAAIIQANSKFRSNNMVPRSMMKKNAENALKDKSKIKDFDKTLRWLASLGVYNQKGDAFSTSIKFSDIPVSDVRMYASMLVDREA